MHHYVPLSEDSESDIFSITLRSEVFHLYCVTEWFSHQSKRKRKYYFSCIYICIYIVDVVEWSRALDVRLSEWCCSVTMVWVQIPSREEQKFDSSKI
jgi:hypothetical protein